jgi:hypothetical protein
LFSCLLQKKGTKHTCHLLDFAAYFSLNWYMAWHIFKESQRNLFFLFNLLYLLFDPSYLVWLSIFLKKMLWIVL